MDNNMNQSTANGGYPGPAPIGNCAVCGAKAAGYHFGAFTCEGCKSFYGRTYKKANMVDPCRGKGACNILGGNRTSCKRCRLQKCYAVGMSRERSRYGRRSASFNEQVLSGSRVDEGRDQHQPEVQQGQQPEVWQVARMDDGTQHHLDRHSLTQTTAGGGGGAEQFEHKVVVDWPATASAHPGQGAASGSAPSRFRYAGEELSVAAQLRQTVGDMGRGHMSDATRAAMLHIGTGRRWSASTSYDSVPMELSAPASIGYLPSEVDLYKSLRLPPNNLPSARNDSLSSGSSPLTPESVSLHPASARFLPTTASFPPEIVSLSPSFSVSPEAFVHGLSPLPTCSSAQRHLLHIPVKLGLQVLQQVQMRQNMPGQGEPAPLDLRREVAPDQDQPLNLSTR